MAYIYSGLILTYIILLKVTQGQEQAFFVDPNAVLVDKWEGWGSSLAWFGDVLGGMPEDVQDIICDAFFSPDKLSINILRYTIGGTTPGDYKCGGYRPGGATESYKDGPDLPYNWERDPRQRRILQKAKELGVDIFEAFSNSPPQWMTISGCSKGNPNGAPLHRNFDAGANGETFVEYLTEIVKYFHENWNITFQTLAPFNEPSSGYWKGESSSQEGCNFNKDDMSRVIGLLYNALEEKGMDYTKIAVADETSINEEIDSQNHFRNQGLTEQIYKVNTHGYSGSRRDLLSSIAARDNRVLWMDEMGWGATEDMTQALNLADRVILDLRNLLPSAWVYWQILEDRGAGYWGLVDITYEDPTIGNIRYNSGYWGMMQFSKYIKKGARIIHVNSGNAVAALNPDTNELIIVILNKGDEVQQSSFDLDLFQPINPSRIYATRTSSEEQNDFIPIEVIPIDGQPLVLKYEAPPKSITTFVIPNAVPKSSNNFITNGDFEDYDGSGLPNGWTLFFGSNGGANRDYIRRGEYSGFIRTGESHLSLNQDLIAPLSKQYYLTAWIASSGDTAKFGIKVNDVQGTELRISRQRGYEVYGISFWGDAGDKISIYLYAERDNSESFIDDITLH